jgi:N,N-dimethylformamidase
MSATMKIVGYTDPLSVRAGEAIDFKISAAVAEYGVQVIRLIHGDEDPKGPGFKAVDVEADINGTYRGEMHAVPSGSYIGFKEDAPLRKVQSFTIAAWIFPTAVARGDQAILGAYGSEGPGYGLFITEDGGLELRLATADDRRGVVRASATVAERLWQFVAGSFDRARGVATLVHRTATGLQTDTDVTTSSLTGFDAWDGAGNRFLIGAGAAGPDDGNRPTNYFNGKIEAPTVIANALDGDSSARLADRVNSNPPLNAVGSWDFSAQQASRTVVDRSPKQLHGKTVNMPTRGVTGHGWDGTSVGFRENPADYAAIHFHDDDLDDCGWPTAFSWHVPNGIQSGIYAARLTALDGSRDTIPFFVRPSSRDDRGDILFLVPTFSYLAYANDHNAADKELQKSLDIGPDFVYPSQPEDQYMIDHHLGGLYDLHTDGTPLVYSSYLRPILNMRPSYLQPLINNGHGDPHQLGADLHLIDWLEHFGYEYHVATDGDVDREGIGCLSNYKVVLTGTHPEYWSFNGLNAVREYLRSGGRMMYLGGNGFYWVTSVEPEGRHTIEVRKWGGTAAFEAPTGEVFHSTTGELGGLWRFRGRHPQRLTGVGMTAQGVAPGVGYRRLPDSHKPRAAFIFAGIGDDELIGDHPCLVNEYGAGGYEIDRADIALGTPRHTLVLATATGLSDRFQHVREEIMLSDSKQGGTVNPKVRADMVYFECPKDGAVWSVGSISWCSALSYNNYDNAVSRITRNVLTAFSSAIPHEHAASKDPEGSRN